MRFIYTKSFAVFFGSLGLVVGLIFLHHQGWLSPVERVVVQLPRPFTYMIQKVIQPARDFFSSVYHLREVIKENAMLKAKVVELQNRQALYDQYALENEKLRAELGFVKSSKLQLKPCRVIGRSPTGFADSLVIDCGTTDGVQMGQAVVSNGFLVGKITYVAPAFSIVQLITSANFSVDAKLSSTGRLAIVRGSFNSGLILDQVAQEEPLPAGSLVVTAGMSERIPKNLLIGEVGNLISQPTDLFQKAAVFSPVDFQALEFVFLVK